MAPLGYLRDRPAAETAKSAWLTTLKHQDWVNTGQPGGRGRPTSGSCWPAGGGSDVATWCRTQAKRLKRLFSEA